jgi:HPt (histidine-containing phosphotransfer) domain-containing protein
MDTNLAFKELEQREAVEESLHLCPVDLKHMRRYTMGDRALEQEVLELFLGQLPQTLGALSGATNEKEWRIAAHTLKGSGRAVGAWRIARLAEHAEHMTGVKNTDLRREAVDRIEDAAREAHEFIAATYGRANI